MQKKNLRTSALLTTAILLVCALALPLSAKDKKQVTRPMKGIGHATVVANLRTGHAEFTQWGEATHLGRWTDSGEGLLDATGNFYSGSGGGTIVAANGDTIEYEFTGPNSNRYTGGTGRFEGVKGGITFTITSATDPVPNGDGTVTTEFTYDMVGEITF